MVNFILFKSGLGTDERVLFSASYPSMVSLSSTHMWCYQAKWVIKLLNLILRYDQYKCSTSLVFHCFWATLKWPDITWNPKSNCDGVFGKSEAQKMANEIKLKPKFWFCPTNDSFCSIMSHMRGFCDQGKLIMKYQMAVGIMKQIHSNDMCFNRVSLSKSSTWPTIV